MRGLALSGGGFRATLFHLGVVNYLYDVERSWKNLPEEESEIEFNRFTEVDDVERLNKAREALTGINYISSVSGGSILSAHLVQNWAQYTNFNGDGDPFRVASQPIIDFARKDIRGRIIRRIPFNFPVHCVSVFWKRVPFFRDSFMPQYLKRSPTDSLERYYDKFLFKKGNLSSLQNLSPETSPKENHPYKTKKPELFIQITNLGQETSSGSFSGNGLQIDMNPGGEHERKHVTAGSSEHNDPTKMSIAKAVAASSAFPGLFSAVLHRHYNDELKLADGGIYDNLGVRKFWDLRKEGTDIKDVIVSDASTAFRPKFGLEIFEHVTVPLRAADILMRRVHRLESDLAEQVDQADKKWKFWFIPLRERVPRKKADLPPSDASLDSQWDESDVHFSDALKEHMNHIRTDLDAFSELEVNALIHHGYQSAKNNLKYPTPDNAKIRSWKPIPGSSGRLVEALFDTNKPEHKKALRSLQKSAKRRWRIASRKDWISYLTVGVPALILILVTIYIADYWRRTKIQQSAVERVVRTLQPQDVDGKFGVIVDRSSTLRQSEEKAFELERLVSIDRAYTIRFVSSEGESYSNAFLVSSYQKAVELRNNLAVESGLTASQTTRILEFDKECKNPEWKTNGLFYDCSALITGSSTPILVSIQDLSTQELERAGFEAILRRDLIGSIKYFALAKEKSPTYHNVDEILKELMHLESVLAVADASTHADLWLKTINKIGSDFSWGMPEDIKKSFREENALPIQ